MANEGGGVSLTSLLAEEILPATVRDGRSVCRVGRSFGGVNRSAGTSLHWHERKQANKQESKRREQARKAELTG
jgi:hypothetical protein